MRDYHNPSFNHTVQNLAQNLNINCYFPLDKPIK